MITLRIENYYTTIKVNGRFVFNTHKDFNCNIVKALESRNNEIVIDISTLEYLDSAALGILLIAKEKAKLVNKTITLKISVNQNSIVNKIIQVSNFSKIFKIKY